MICEQMTDARRKTRPIASNRHLLEGRRVQSRATGACSKEDASNHEQLALARRKTRPIASNWHLLVGRRVQSRATGTCSKEDASNREQLALSRRKTHPIMSNARAANLSTTGMTCAPEWLNASATSPR